MLKNILISTFIVLISTQSFAKIETYKIISGGGNDDMQLTLQNQNSKKYTAYCNTKCGNWFEPDDEISTLKKQYIGKKVQAEIKFEQNKGRVAGPSDDEKFYFIKYLKLL
ncbi:hypothetical protein [Acinetobacter gerneri]|jgi:hypothetical protein|uniref:hypothetical protein n=1 Tax=Acinetobacter gerneri TaxID=202952 RepID=UPI0023F08E85|nr:hypothetical protein [Acinetobacter gerneri]MCH4242781.1 hypothetical protein [Acinetobacter gerneri]